MRPLPLIILLLTSKALSLPLLPPKLNDPLTPEELRIIANFFPSYSNTNAFLSSSVDPPKNSISRHGKAQDLKKTISQAKKKHKENLKKAQKIKNNNNSSSNNENNISPEDAVDRMLDRIVRHLEKLEEERTRRARAKGHKSTPSSNAPLIDFRPTINTECLGLGISVCDPIRVGGKDGDHVIISDNLGDDSSVKGDGNKIYGGGGGGGRGGKGYSEGGEKEWTEEDERREKNRQLKKTLKENYRLDGFPWDGRRLEADGDAEKEYYAGKGKGGEGSYGGKEKDYYGDENGGGGEYGYEKPHLSRH